MSIVQYKSTAKQHSHKLAYRGCFSPIGLDIGSSRIKMLQLTQSGREPAVYRCVDVPTPAGSFQEGKNDEFAQTLKKIVMQTGFHHNRVHISLPGQAMTLRRITLPRLSPLETKRAMRWEAEKHLPLSADETIFDYAYLNSRVDGRNTVYNYILTAVPKKIAAVCAEAAAKAGLYPESIETAPFALHRAIHWCNTIHPHPHHETLLAVHIGAENSDLLLLHQGLYRFYRQLNLGVNHFFRDASAFSGLNPTNTLQLLWSDKPLSQRGLDQSTAKLARQITRSLEFYAYETDYPEKQCRSALLCGGGSMIPGLDSYLSNELGLETIRFNPLAPPYMKQDVTNSSTEAAPGPLYTASLGLTLRGWIR